MASKLTRATVPMCPKKECGCELQLAPGDNLQCPHCGYVDDGRYEAPVWGYYPPDVSGVVADMQDAADALVEGDWSCRVRDLLDWIKQLKGTS